MLKETPKLQLYQSTRLKKLRNDLIDAKYELCIQKSFWITDYFKQYLASSNFKNFLENKHYQGYRDTLDSIAKGKPIADYKLMVNKLLGKYYSQVYKKLNQDLLNVYSGAFYHVLENVELKIYPNELIVGNSSSKRIGAPVHTDLSGMLLSPELETISTRKVNPIAISQKEIDILKKEIFPFWFNKSVLYHTSLNIDEPKILSQMLTGGFFVLTQVAGISHLTPDYEKVLKIGFIGIKKEIKQNLKKEGLSKKQKLFYDSGITCCDAAIMFAKRWHNKLLNEAEKETDQERKTELLTLAGIFKNIPERPAETFYEALQSIMITHTMVHQENFQHGVSFGQLDKMLYPYYKSDLKNDLITPDKAVELLGCFMGKAAELLPLFFENATEYFSGLSSASGITLSGENELSSLILIAYDQMRLRQPNIHVRVSGQTSEKFLNLCYDVLKKGGGMPAFFNDPLIISSLQNNGYSLEDSRQYSVVGCSEWGVPNKSFPAAGSGFINLAFVLNTALGTHLQETIVKINNTTELSKITNIDELLNVFFKKLKEVLYIASSLNNSIEDTHRDYRPTPFLSCIIEGCVTKGKDVTTGGAIYNSSGFQGVGLADVADSFYVIDQLVFKDKKIKLCDLLKVIKNNFNDNIELKKYIQNKLEKFGQGNKKVDHFTKIISKKYSELVTQSYHSRGGKYLPGFWTMTTHQGFGKRTNATPNGRLKFENLSNGISPGVGNESLGPTAALRSGSAVSPELMGNGVVLNQKISQDSIKGKKGNIILNGLLKGYFSHGGMQVQFNILDPQVLMEARKFPEKYKDLVVRISGYSAYFNDLTDDMKNELIKRNSHNV